MHRFRVNAIVDPQSLPRVANHFAQRSIVPAAMTMRVLPTHMHIEIDVAGLDAMQAEVIAAKLGEVVAVMRSELESVERAVSASDRARPALTAVG
ncbi:hypothetical protein SKP52_15410 [Sphingopyxis fribergensis]|uniref:ACT domain-containing protein n=1 Tax=Sphingopyxis fribergensis TaxID=1515612 RepID=A0A0A7PIK4_9SPHN|nr:hypothetical protein [Sphingopyxis fribergensis]AJA09961.1 hypothetical protein SKP52_15410 [Sphingopyxis fribergensis]